MGINMNFCIELTSFPSAVHKNIYSAARGLTPLKKSLVSITDPETHASCTAFHSFVVDMLSDMYDNPKEYYLPVLMLEDFCDGKKVNGMKQKFPSKTKSLLSQTRNVVNSYMALLCMLGRFGTLASEYICKPDIS